MPLTLEITKRAPEEKLNEFVLDGRDPPASWFDLQQLTCCVPLNGRALASAANVIEHHPLGKRITVHIYVPLLTELEGLQWEMLLIVGGTVRITVPPGATLPGATLASCVNTFVIAPECLDEPVALRALSEYPKWHDPAALARAVADRTPYIASVLDVTAAAP